MRSLVFHLADGRMEASFLAFFGQPGFPHKLGCARFDFDPDIDPQPLYRISRFPRIDDYRVDERTVLIPRSGQIYGIIGTVFQPIGRVLQSAVTEDAIRINCRSAEQAGYVFLALRAECGRRQLKARAFGNSTLRLDVANVGNIPVPDLPNREVARLGNWACRIARYRTTAVDREHEARSLIESTLECTSSPSDGAAHAHPARG